MTTSIDDLRLEYMANYYADKIQQIPDKESALEATKQLMSQLVIDAGISNTDKKNK